MDRGHGTRQPRLAASLCTPVGASLLCRCTLQRHPSSAADRAAAGGGGVGGGAAATAAAPSLASSLASVALAAWLHGRLVRLACGGAPYPPLRCRLLEFLTAHLALGPRGAEVDR